MKLPDTCFHALLWFIALPVAFAGQAGAQSTDQGPGSAVKLTTVEKQQKIAELEGSR